MLIINCPACNRRFTDANTCSHCGHQLTSPERAAAVIEGKAREKQDRRADTWRMVNRIGGPVLGFAILIGVISGVLISVASTNHVKQSGSTTSSAPKYLGNVTLKQWRDADDRDRLETARRLMAEYQYSAEGPRDLIRVLDKLSLDWPDQTVSEAAAPILRLAASNPAN